MNKDIDWAIRQVAPAPCKHVLLVLANRADKHHQCFPSLTSLTADTGMGRRTVIRSIQALEKLDLISRQNRGINTTLYTLLVVPDRHHEQCQTDTNSSATVTPPVVPVRHHQKFPVVPERHLSSATVTPPVVPQRLMESPIEPKLTQKGNGEPKNETRKTKPPADFPVTSKHREWAAKNRVTVNLENETEQMLDHFRGKGESRLDWQATWRTWMRNSVKFAARRNNGYGGNGNGTHKTKDEINRENAARVLSRLHPEAGGGDERDADGGDADGVPRATVGS